MGVAESSHGLAVLRLLADGERHSGQQLAASLGISRAAVWKQVQTLRRLGLETMAVRGAGYRLERPIELLTRSVIEGFLSATARRQLERLELFTVLESTNTFLLSGSRPATRKVAVCLAEMQSAGRGRRGRAWLAPLGGGLCLSIAAVFATQPEDLAALGLAAGVIARRVVVASTGLPVQLKWPNDLLVHDRKLGGILVELSAESHGPCFVVIGVGINVSAVPRLHPGDGAWIPGAIDLAAASGAAPPSRNRLAADLIEAYTGLLADYETRGFAGYHAEFTDGDYLCGRRIAAEGARGTTEGCAMGVGLDGALLIETANGVARIVAGDVSVRPSA